MYRLIQISVNDNDISCLLIDYKNLQKTVLNIKDTLQLIQKGLVSNFIIDGGTIRCQDSQSKSIYVEYHYSDRVTRNKLLKIMTGRIKVNIGGKLYNLPEFSDDKIVRNPQKIIHILAKIKDSNSFVCCDSYGNVFTSSKEDIIKGVRESKGLSNPVKLVNIKITNNNIQAIRGQLFEIQINRNKNSKKQPKNKNINWKYLLRYSKFCDIPGNRMRGYRAWNSMQSGDQFKGTLIDRTFDDYYRNTEYSIIMHGNNKANILGYMVQQANRQFDYHKSIGYLSKYDLEDYICPHIIKIVGSNEKKVIRRVSAEYSILCKQDAWIKHYPRLFKYFDNHRRSDFRPNASEELHLAAMQDFIAYRIKNDSKMREKLKDVKDDIDSVLNQMNYKHVVMLALYIDHLTSKYNDIADSTVLVGQAIALKASLLQDQFRGSEIERLADKISDDIKVIAGFITAENLKLFRNPTYISSQDAWEEHALTDMYGRSKYWAYDLQVATIENKRKLEISQSYKYTPLMAYHNIVKSLVTLSEPLKYQYIDGSGIEWRTIIPADGSEIQLQQSDTNFDINHPLYYNVNSCTQPGFYMIRQGLVILADQTYSSIGNKIGYEFRALILCKRNTRYGLIMDLLYVPLRVNESMMMNDGGMAVDIYIKSYVINQKIYYAVKEGHTCYILSPHETNFNSFEDSRYDLQTQKYSDMNIDRPLIFDYFQQKNHVNTLTVYRGFNYSSQFDSDKSTDDPDVNFFSEIALDSKEIAKHVLKTW